MTTTPEQREILNADRESKLPVRAWSIIVREGLTLTDLTTTPDRELLKLRGMGPHTLAGLREAIPYRGGQAAPPERVRRRRASRPCPDGYTTTTDAAERLGYQRSTVLNACRQGRVAGAMRETGTRGARWIVPTRYCDPAVWAAEVTGIAPTPAGYMTVLEAAKAIGMSPSALRTALQRGHVPDVVWESVKGRTRQLIPERFCTPEAWRKLVGGQGFQRGQDPREKRTRP